MYKVFNIGGVAVAANATAALPYRYQQVFHEDFLAFIGKDVDRNTVIDLAGKILYITNASATKKDMGSLSFDGFLEFLETIGNGELIEVSTDIVTFAFDSAKSTVDAKKNPGPQNET